MRVRSGYKRTHRKRMTIFALWRLINKYIDRVLGMCLFDLRQSAKKNPMVKKSFLKRDVHKKSYANPYKSKPKTIVIPQILKNNRLRIMKGILLILLIAWWTALFGNEEFYISHIFIEGTQEISADELKEIVKHQLENRSLIGVKKSHILLLDEQAMREAINDTYRLESVAFAPEWRSGSIQVSVKEKTTELLYGAGKAYFSIDQQGNVIRKLHDPKEVKASRARMPLIYRYDTEQEPGIGQNVLSAMAIANINRLHDEFKKYPSFHIHSFRIRPIEQKEVRIPEKLPSTAEEKQDDNKENTDQELAELQRSVAQARTNKENLDALRKKIENLDIEEVEEGNALEYLKTERTYKPDPNVSFLQLNIYMHEGWTMKLGHESFKENAAQNYLDIFATLAKKIDLKEGVREYIDLRFDDRVYYR